MKLILIRGVSSSGKSTLANRLRIALGARWYEANQFFEVETKWGNKYKFDPKRLGEAHEWCQERTKTALTLGLDVVVSNTFTRRWEIEPYYRLAKEFGAEFSVLTLESGLSAEELAERNEHGLTAEMIQKQIERFEPWTIPQE